MKHFFLLTTTLILLSNYVFSQSYYNLYKSQLPGEIQSNIQFINDVNRTLDLYTQFDPDLIYFYLMNLELKFDKEISNSDSNFTNLLQGRYSKAKQLKQDWAKTQIELINQYITPAIRARKVASYFSEFTFESFKEVLIPHDVPIDTNKQAFYKYIYFKKETGLSYDPQKNYVLLCDKIISDMVEDFNQKYENLSKLSSIEKKLFQHSAFKYPYLFKGTYLSKYKSVTSFYIYELIDKIISKDYENLNTINAQISYGVLPITFEDKLSVTDPDPFDQSYEHKTKVHVKNTFFGILGLIVKTSSDFKPLSFYSFKFGYAFAQTISNDLKDHIFFDGIKAIPGLTLFTGKYYIHNYRKFKSNSYLAQLTFPVYYIHPKLYFETGLNYQMQNLSYEYNFAKEGTYTNPYGRDVPDDFFSDDVVKYDETKHSIHPVLALNFYIIRNLNIRFEYLIPNQIVFNLGAHYTF